MIGDCCVPTNNPILGKQEKSKGFKREFVMHFGGEAFQVENPKASRVDSMISERFLVYISYGVS